MRLTILGVKPTRSAPARPTGESVRESLLEALLETNDRPRIRIKICDLFTEQEWPVKGYRPKGRTRSAGRLLHHGKGFHSEEVVLKAPAARSWAIFCMGLWLMGTSAWRLLRRRTFTLLIGCLRQVPIIRSP